MSEQDDAKRIGPALLAGRTHVDSMLTLRDYFAAAAMNGCLSNPTTNYAPSAFEANRGVTWYERAATEAYAIADAMVKAR